jgi:hypothetical protein
MVAQMRAAYEAAPDGKKVEHALGVATSRGLARQTARKIINADFVHTFGWQHPSKSRKCSEAQIDRALELIEEAPTTPLKRIIERMQTDPVDPAPQISASTLTSYLEGRLITYKQVTRHNQQRNSPEVKVERQAYVAEADRAVQAGFGAVFLDETGVSNGLHRSRGRAPIGQEAIVIGPRSDGRNESIFCAVNSTHGLVHFAHRPGAYKADTFEIEFDTMVTKMVGLDIRKAWIVADNCRIHKKAVLAGIADAKARQAERDHGGRFEYVVKFLPPYSPMLNPIEEVFADLKRSIREQFDDPLQLHPQVLAIARQPWGQQGTFRGRLLQPAFYTTVGVITPASVAAHERHSQSFFLAASQLLDV